MNRSVATCDEETEGNPDATSCQPSTANAVRCWMEAVRAAGYEKDEAIAAECGMTPSHYSKVARGNQGSLLELADRLPEKLAHIKTDFYRRLGELVETDPFEAAVEAAVRANQRVLCLLMRRQHRLPTRASVMATARH